MTQNSPKAQWKVRSLKYSLLRARVSMRMIWSTAAGMVNMFELKVLKPRFLRVSDK